MTLSRCSIVVARDRNGCRRARPRRRARGDQRGGRPAHPRVRDAGARACRRPCGDVDGGRRADRPARCRRQRHRAVWAPVGRSCSARTSTRSRTPAGTTDRSACSRRSPSPSGWPCAGTVARSRSSRSPTRRGLASGPPTSARAPTRAASSARGSTSSTRRGSRSATRSADAGGDPDMAVTAPVPELAGYVEVHIEQGPVLEREGLPVGVVTAIAGQTRARIVLTGEAGHAGTLPMDARRDALAAAAEVVLAVERLGRAEAGLVATVGALSLSPNVGNVVPGEARMLLDVRHADDRIRRRAADGDSRRGRADRGGARRRRGMDAAVRHPRRRARPAAPRPPRRCRPGPGSAPPRARQRRGARRGRPLPHLSGGDAVRPLRRGHQSRPARVGLRGGRRGRARRPRAGRALVRLGPGHGDAARLRT